MIFKNLPNLSGINLSRSNTRPRRIGVSVPNVDLDTLLNSTPSATLPINPAINRTPLTLGQQKASKMDILGNILSAIATGIGVGFSQNPGESLLQTLSQQRQERLAREQAQLERQEREEERRLRKEEQENNRTFQERILNKEQGFTAEQKALDRQQESTKFNLTLEEQKADRSAREALEKLKLSTQVELENKSLALREKLATAELEGENKKQQVSTFMSLLAAGVNPTKVVDIVDKIQKGIDFNTDDEKIIKSALNSIEAKQKSKGVGRGSSVGQPDKVAIRQWQDDRRQIANRIILNSQEPVINPVTGMPVTDKNGNPVTKVSGDVETRVQEALDIYDKVNPAPVPQSNKTNGPDLTGTDQSQVVLGQIDQWIDQGINETEITNVINKELKGPLKTQALARLKQKRKTPVGKQFDIRQYLR